MPNKIQATKDAKSEEQLVIIEQLRKEKPTSLHELDEIVGAMNTNANDVMSLANKVNIHQFIRTQFVNNPNLKFVVDTDPEVDDVYFAYSEEGKECLRQSQS